MLVVSDNSALSALAQIGLLEILPEVVGQVTVPGSVASEGLSLGAPEGLRLLLQNPPDWLLLVPDPLELLIETEGLGAGESAAITLAWEYRSQSVVILDVRRGRRVAESLGLRMLGLLSILSQAAILGLVDFDEVLSRLLETGFRLSETLIEDARRKVAAAAANSPSIG